MIRKDVNVKIGLHVLGLNADEIEVYLALLRAPASPLELSRRTSINRTKVYDLLSRLEKRSLITRQTDDRGTFFVITEPANLGIKLGEREEELKKQKETLGQLMPMLQALRGAGRTTSFAVRTYEGIEGFKQMLWHELKTKGELLTLGGGDVEELMPDKTWAARHRQHTVEAGYRIREILNSETDLPTVIGNGEFLQLYTCRGLPAHMIPLEDQVTIYNDTTAIYSWRRDKKVGVEIISKSFTATMRATFEYLWKQTEPPVTRL